MDDPGNRAISFSSKIAYGLYEVTAAPEGNWAKVGDKLHPRRQARRRRDEGGEGRSLRAAAATSRRDAARRPSSPRIRCAALGYDFDVPLLDGDHVTDDTGTGFVHTAPGHGADDYIIWMASGSQAERARHRHRRSPSPSMPTAS